MDDKPIESWFWNVPGSTWPFKRIKSTWRMTEATARERYGDAAEKVEGSLEVSHPPGNTGDMLRNAPASPGCTSYRKPG